MSVNDAIQIFEAAVTAVKPEQLLRQHISLDAGSVRLGDVNLRLSQVHRLIVIGAGKAAAAMAAVVEEILEPVISEGLIITKYQHALPLKKIRCVEAGHPVPDQNGLDGNAELVDLVENLEARDVVLFLVSGGASALLADLVTGVEPDDLKSLSRLLLASGATIHEINTIRKHLSYIKGGQLSALVAPARLISFILSDVNGDDLSVIASGPTVPDASTFQDALAVIDKYQLAKRLPVSIMHWLKDGAAGDHPETPKPGDPVFGLTFNQLIGTNKISLDAAFTTAGKLGYHAAVINTLLDGDAEEEAQKFVDACLLYNGPRPACLLMGGETTVTIQGKGKGGRNQHFVLAALVGLQKKLADKTVVSVSVTGSLMAELVDPSLVPVILSGGTDGTDGPTDAAGAVIDGNAMKFAGAAAYLADNDAYHFFDKNGGLIKTGPTQTNVMDVVIGLIR